MNKTKETFVFGFALFASFFGAGNLILPPMLGFNSGPDWWLVVIGFVVSAVLVPLLALFAYARLQGTMLDFGNKVSPLFSLLYCLSVYIIAVTLPMPRTAAVTHEMAIEPYFDTSSLLTSSVYFILVFLFVINRPNVLQILGKYLTPLIIIIVLAVIGIGLFSPANDMNASLMETPLIGGLLEGYQTYDAIGGVLIGAVLVISLNLKGYTTFEEKKSMIARSGLVAAGGLFIIYAGLIALGAYFNSQFDGNISRTELLTGLSLKTLGNIGTIFLSVLVALACFTTAVLVFVGVADFFKGLFNNSKKAYFITAFISCFLGVLIGQFDVHYIIQVAVPALMFIYPLTIVLILLNVIPQKWASKLVFRAVVLITFIFSIPDFLGILMPGESLLQLKNWIPLSKHSLGWVLPALIVFIFFNAKKMLSKAN